MNKAVIFDVDGTLAHMNGKRGPFELHNVHLDDVDDIVMTNLISLYYAGYHIIIMSGRDEVCRQLTHSWLVTNLRKLNNDYDVDFELHMRPEKDMRKDTLIKHELYMKHVDAMYDVKAVYEDRPVVCRMWMEMGLRVIHCGNPYEEF